MEAIKAAGDTPYVVGSVEAGEKGSELMLKLAVTGIRRRHQPTGDHGCGSHAVPSPMQKIVAVISNNTNAYALDPGRTGGDSGVVHLARRTMHDREAFHEALLKALVECR